MIRPLLLLLVSFTTASLFAQLANEPASQPSNLIKSGADLTYTHDISFDASGADGYLVLRSTEPVTFTPVDGTVYEKGQGLGNAKVFSAGISTFLRIKEVVASTDYYYTVYAYNQNTGDPTSINYLTASPLTAVITSASPNYQSYYSGIDWASSNLLKDLKDLINPHTIMSYSDFGRNMIPNVFERDTVGGAHVIECQYSAEIAVYSGSFNFSTSGYNREHRMPVSWMDFNNIPRNDFELLPEGADYHALELVQEDVNSERLNYPYSSDVVSTSYVYIRFKRGKDSRNKTVAEVRSDRKGDAARALMYMMVAYNGKNSRNWGLDNLLSDAENQDVQQLLDWNTQDPPDGLEKARNEYIYSIQGNRNPFIDYPDLANCIDFTDVTLKGDCSYVGLTELLTQAQTRVYPQPAINGVIFDIAVPLAARAQMTIYSLDGQIIQTLPVEGSAAGTKLNVDLSEYPAGLYIYNLSSSKYQTSGRLLVGQR